MSLGEHEAFTALAYSPTEGCTVADLPESCLRSSVAENLPTPDIELTAGIISPM